MKRKIISDDKVFAIWKDRNTGEEISIEPTFYAEAGIPIDEDGDEFIYVRTEIEE